jgi:hypothetical protein
MSCFKGIESFSSFWESKKIISYTEALKKSPYLNALCEHDAEDLCRLGMYFDTVVTVDRVSGIILNPAGDTINGLLDDGKPKLKESRGTVDEDRVNVRS